MAALAVVLGLLIVAIAFARNLAELVILVTALQFVMVAMISSLPLPRSTRDLVTALLAISLDS